MNEVICKVCNQTTFYDKRYVQTKENNKIYIFCEHCMNEIIIEEEK
jgi:hypothetical protein